MNAGNVVFSPEQNVNFMMLQHFFHKNNMTVRLDSEYCVNYILYKEGDLHQILRKMQEARFLHECCKFDDGYLEAKHQRGTQHLTKEQWLAMIKDNVLRVSGYQNFPQTWPWDELY